MLTKKTNELLTNYKSVYINIKCIQKKRNLIKKSAIKNKKIAKVNFLKKRKNIKNKKMQKKVIVMKKNRKKR